jgi:hypothetical protein
MLSFLGEFFFLFVVRKHCCAEEIVFLLVSFTVGPLLRKLQKHAERKQYYRLSTAVKWGDLERCHSSLMDQTNFFLSPGIY